MPRSPTYLKKRRLGWYVQYPVPTHLWERVGAKTIERTLSTRDPVEANKKRHAVIAAIQRELVAAEGRPLPDSAESLLEDAVELRASIEAGKADPEETDRGFDAQVEGYLERQAKKLGRGADGSPLLSAKDERLVRRAHKAFSGSLALTLRHQLDAFLQEEASHLTQSFLEEKRRRLEFFLAWFGEDRDCTEVTRKDLGRYVTEVVQQRRQLRSKGEPTAAPLVSVATRQKEASAVHSFFSWLSARGVIDDDPSLGMSRTIRASKRGIAAARRPWRPEELLTVLKGVDKDDPVWSLTVICAFSGMRREEVCQLRVEDVEKHVFRVREGKTQAAVRRVPIHPTIAPLIQRLVKTNTDGYLIPGLTETGKDKKRGTLIGKRFLTAIRGLGIEDPELDLHAFRGTVVTQLEPLVELSLIQRIVGHRRQGVTLSHYAGDVSDKILKEVLSRVSYGKRVQELILTAAPQVSISRKTGSRLRRLS